MKPITRFIAGDTERTSLSADAMNEIVAAVNSLMAIKIHPPGLATVSLADSGVSINFNGDSFQEVAENGVISYYFVAKRTGPVT